MRTLSLRPVTAGTCSFCERPAVEQATVDDVDVRLACSGHWFSLLTHCYNLSTPKKEEA